MAGRDQIAFRRFANIPAKGDRTLPNTHFSFGDGAKNLLSARHACVVAGQARGMELLPRIGVALVPALCASCGRSCRIEAVVCTRCARRLGRAEPLLGNGPAGLDKAWSSASYEGVARNLVGALKFRRLLPVADLMAERIEWLAPAHMLSGTVVPVPPAPARLRRRGFDPAGELAAALAARLEAPLAPCLERRGGGRQVGKRRAERVGHPPRIHARDGAPRSVLLVDDVLTTGATLTACARALRAVGASRVVAVTFARRL
jgi:predicted amidophosphoribosyltransferase